MYNSILCTFLNILQAIFTITYKYMKGKNEWITQGMKITCKHKRSLYAFTKNSKDPKVKAHYTKYGKILRKVIK